MISESKECKNAFVDTTIRSLKRLSIGTCLGLSLLTLSVQADWQPNAGFGLGEAGEFAVLSLGKPSAETDGQSKLDLSGVTIYGNAGVGPYGILDFQGPATINGDLILDPTLRDQDIISDAGTVTGSRIIRDLSSVVGTATQAAEANKALLPTEIHGKISTSMTLFGNGGMNVIRIDGIDYRRSNATTPLQLTLKGGDNDLFVLNISGKFVLGPNSSIRGIDPSQVLINVLPGNTPVSFAANSYVGGTLLSVSRKMGPLLGASGPVIGALEQEISLVGGAVLNPPPTAPLAVIGADQTVVVGTPVQLDGSASTAPFGGDLTYLWSMEIKPDGSMAELCGATNVNPYFTPDIVGDYVVELVVNDGSQDSDPAEATVTAIVSGEGVDLSLQIAESKDPVTVKTELIYTLTVNNKSSSAASLVTLNASLLDDFRGTPVIEPWTGGTCSYLVGNVTCKLDELAGGATATVRIILLPKKAGDFHIEASVNSLGEDPYPSDNVAAERTGVTKQILP